MTKKIEIQKPPVKRRFNYIGVGQFQIELDWFHTDTGEAQTVCLHSSQVVELIHANISLGHEYIMITCDTDGNYSVIIDFGGVQVRRDLARYVQKYASRYADRLIPILEKEGVVEDFLMDEADAA